MMTRSRISVVVPALNGGDAFGYLCRHLMQVRARMDVDVLDGRALAPRELLGAL